MRTVLLLLPRTSAGKCRGVLRGVGSEFQSVMLRNCVLRAAAASDVPEVFPSHL